MEDYYKDATYGLEELQSLIKELNELRVLFCNNEQTAKQLEHLLIACKKAKPSIRVFGCTTIKVHNKMFNWTTISNSFKASTTFVDRLFAR